MADSVEKCKREGLLWASCAFHRKYRNYEFQAHKWSKKVIITSGKLKLFSDAPVGGFGCREGTRKSISRW